MPTRQSLAQCLPDLPRWVEVRDLLLSGDGEVTGLVETPALAFIIREPGERTAFVVGAPPASALQAMARALGPGGRLYAPHEQTAWLAAALPAGQTQRVFLHTLAQPQRLPRVVPGQVDFMDPTKLAQYDLPSDLLTDLQAASAYTAVAAAWVDGRPVSFCYAGSETEALWDISIDTLPAYRRQGHAARCVAFLVAHQRRMGRQPVWGAVESNPASWRLAEKIGFARVDELVEFSFPVHSGRI
jgi:GNAT superfamily N-acetyltransferase